MDINLFSAAGFTNKETRALSDICKNNNVHPQVILNAVLSVAQHPVQPGTEWTCIKGMLGGQVFKGETCKVLSYTADYVEVQYSCGTTCGGTITSFQPGVTHVRNR